MVREVIEHTARTGGAVAAGHALTVEEYVLALRRAGKIGFSHHARRHVPVERAVGRQIPVRLAHAVAVAVIGIGVAGSASKTVLLVKGVIQAAGGVMGYVARGIVEIRAGEPVVISGDNAQVFRRALGDGLGEQISPRVVPVVLPQNFLLPPRTVAVQSVPAFCAGTNRFSAS